ncbi:MAG TPA: SHOCT domain-containing protein [Anaerolineae bacterium]
MSKTARNIAAILGIVLLIVIVGGIAAFAVLGRGLATGYRMMQPGFGMMRFGFPFGGGIVAGLFLLLLVGGIILIAAAPGRRVEAPRDNLPMDETPLDILKRRYAKGEITKEQYDQMKQDLGV